MNVLGWDCWGGDAGIRHANVVQLGVTPEEAMLRLLERAELKYGAGLEWGAWDLRAEPIPKTSGADVVRFVWRDGALRRRSSLRLSAGTPRRPRAARRRPGRVRHRSGLTARGEQSQDCVELEGFPKLADYQGRLRERPATRRNEHNGDVLGRPQTA